MANAATPAEHDAPAPPSAPAGRSDGVRAWALAVAVVVMIGCWILVTPPNAGPDEAGHLVRSVAVVDGEPGSVRIEGPAWTVFPDISCYALFGDRPASCAPTGDEPDADVALLTRAWDYPIWGHVLPGLALEVSTATTSPYLPRVASALIAGGLVVAGLLVARRRARMSGALALLAITPMAWFSFGIVNPSGPAIAGAFAVWAVVLFGPPRRDDADTRPAWGRRHDWLFAAGLAAAMLPRRDSVFWAAVVLVAACVATDTSAFDRLRRLATGPAVLLGAAVLASAWWAVDNGTQTLGLFALSLGLVVAHEVWRRLRRSAPGRAPWVDAAALAGLVVLVVALVILREDGWDGTLLWAVVGETGANLLEAVGAVGTLDARIPLWTLALYAATVVGLALLSLGGLSSDGVRASGPVRDRTVRAVWTGVGVLAAAIVAAWALEMQRGNTTGTYWQGRYSLPLLLGVPMLVGLPLVGRRGRAGGLRPVLPAVVATVSTIVSVVVFVVAVRRWGVGTSGSWNPSDWDTYGAPLPTTLLLVVHALAAVTLAWAVATRAAGTTDPPHRSSPAGTTVAADVEP